MAGHAAASRASRTRPPCACSAPSSPIRRPCWGLRGLREEIAAGDGSPLRGARARLPHRERVLAINRRLARRILEAQAAWLDEVEAELGAP